jgi:hypothetical protein
VVFEIYFGKLKSQIYGNKNIILKLLRDSKSQNIEDFKKECNFNKVFDIDEEGKKKFLKIIKII